jgi:membrane-associated phospholipid phosphatase
VYAVLRRALIAVLGAIGCAAAAAIVWGLAFHVPRAAWADDKLLNGLERFQSTPVGRVAEPLASLANPFPYVLLAGLVVILAARVRGASGALAVVFVVAGASLTTEHLKPALAVQRVSLQVDAASWPSGHSTAAMALALSAAIAAPAISRWVLAFAGVLLAIGVGGSVVLLGWHYPSDAVGGFLVAGCFACLALAGLELSLDPPILAANQRRLQGHPTDRPSTRVIHPVDARPIDA